MFGKTHSVWYSGSVSLNKWKGEGGEGSTYIGLVTQNMCHTQPFCLGKERAPLSEINVLVKTNSMEPTPSSALSQTVKK